MSLPRRSLAAAAGIVADLALGEPAVQPHPVSAFGARVLLLRPRGNSKLQRLRIEKFATTVNRASASSL